MEGSDCVFCKIANKAIPADIVYEDGAAVAILDIHPRAPGHTMVLPKPHWENILEVPESELGPLFSAVKKVTSLLEKAFVPHGFTTGINHGKAGGQTVDHLHIHIIPRFEDDGGGSIHSVVNNPSGESREAILTKIRKQITN